MNRSFDVIAPDRARGGRGHPLLSTKLVPPKLPTGHVFRDRLLDQLSAAVDAHGLTLISAPAGSGKSVLAAAWLASDPTPGPVAWLDVDRADDEPAAFWRYVIAALTESGVGLPNLAGRDGGFDEADLSWLAADLLEQTAPVVLILDNAHHVNHPSVLGGLDFLLTRAAAGLRLVLCTRTDPALPLYRYRLLESLAEIRMADLAFDEHEAEQLLKSHGVPMTADLASSITAHTNGWAVGLRLAAIALEQSTDSGGLASSFEMTESTTSEYLLSEVLDAQPRELRETLLRASVASQLWPELVEELVGPAGGTGLISALERANLLVTELDSTTDGRRVHPLLNDALKLRLAYESPELVADLHRRCAAWLARSGDLPLAVDHALAAADAPFAASLLIDGLALGSLVGPRSGLGAERSVEPILACGSGAAAALVQAAVAIGRSDPTTGRRHLARADQLRHPDRETIQFTLSATVLRAMVDAESGDGHATIGACDAAEALLGRMGGEHPGIRALLLASRGTALMWQRRPIAAESTLQRAIAIATANGARHLQAHCLGTLALLHASQGRFVRASEFGRQANEICLDAGLPPHDLPSVAAVALAWAGVQQGRESEARHWIERAAAGATQSPHPVFAPLLAMLSARLTDAGSTPMAGERPAPVDRSAAVVPWAAGNVLEHALRLAEPPRIRRRFDDATAPIRESDLPDPLSPRELEVLHHLAELLPTKDIAAAMFVSVNTIRTHVRNILRKLDVTGRNEAIRRGWQLGLI